MLSASSLPTNPAPSDQREVATQQPTILGQFEGIFIGTRREPSFLAKIKVFVPEGTQIAVPREYAESVQQGQMNYFAYLPRLDADGKMEMYPRPDLVLTKEQAENLDNGFVAVKLEPCNGEMLVIIPDLIFKGPVPPGWPHMDMQTLTLEHSG